MKLVLPLRESRGTPTIIDKCGHHKEAHTNCKKYSVMFHVKFRILLVNKPERGFDITYTEKILLLLLDDKQKGHRCCQLIEEQPRWDMLPDHC